MEPNPNLEKEKKINASFELMRPLIEFCGERIPAGKIILDVGSGEGILALKIAEALKAGKIILTDVTESLTVELPSNAEFHQIDLYSGDFLWKFQNRVEVVICTATFHEFSSPIEAVRNLFSVLPIGGIALIFDYSQQGWEHQRSIALTESPASILHFQEDIKRAKQTGLDTDVGIREFWENIIFPKVPGECYFSFNGDLYTVVYIAQQWGGVKPIPPGMEQVLRKLGYVK